MRNALIVLILLISAQLYSQSDSTRVKQPKIRYTSSFLSEQWELGDKDVKEKDIQLHLEKTSPEAYYQFRTGQSQAKTGLAFTIIGGAAAIGSLLVKSNGAKIGCLVVAGVGITVGLVEIFSATSHAKKAIDTYNHQYGY